jgi:putative transposase
LILKAASLIKPRQRRRRVPVLPGTLAPAKAPNELWTADFKGQFVLGDRRWCYPLTVMDHHSRYLIGCRGQYTTAGAPTRRAFEAWFRTYGLPQRIRTDNGVPFASRTAGGLSRLAIWWIRLGILPERIRPGRPQQNGRHERMHRTLKAVATRPAAMNLGAQQRQFDRFQQLYNEQRPHEALAQRTPSVCYRPSIRSYPERLPELAYPDYYHVHVVRPSGVIQKFNRQFYVSHVLAGECVGMCQVSESVWDVYFGPLRLGGFDLAKHCATSQRDDYFTLKV